MPSKPNLLVIMPDQHAAGVIGGLGHLAVKTPSLDRLMSAGVTFTNAYCTYPICTPSRARRCYYGMVTCMDEQVGRLLTALDNLGAMDNTWVVYLALR